MGEGRDLPIGVMDSGLGGISVLRLAADRLPGERFVYYGDTANVPYGEKPQARIRELFHLHQCFPLELDQEALHVNRVPKLGNFFGGPLEVARDRNGDAGLEP